MKKIFRFLALVFFWCSISISIQFYRELSAKDWIENIIFAVIFAIAYMLITYYHDKEKKDKN